MYAFEYVRPTSVAEAVQALKANEDAKFLAGGQTYIPTLKQRLAMPTALIDLGGIAELKGIREEGDSLVFGAMTRYGEVAASEIVKRRIPGLAAMALIIGDPQVRNRGTVGGSIANNDPSADYPAALLAVGGTVLTDRREIPAEDFFTGMFETALEPDELVTGIRFPVPEACHYEKFRNPASRYAIVGVMIAKTAKGVRVAVSGAGPTAFRSSELESALAADFSAAAVDGVTISPDGLNEDMHASAAYRANLVKVLTKRAVAALS